MKIELNGKKALVTGSSGGIGLAIAAGLAEAGAEVVLHGRNADKLAQAAASLAKQFPAERVSTVQADLATADGAGGGAGGPPAGHCRRRGLDLGRPSRRRHPDQQRRLLRAQVLH
jgi:short-subunit dehydrogenase